MKIILFITFLSIQFSYAFKPTNKNINTLANIICENYQVVQDSRSITKVDISRSLGNEISISTICNAKIAQNKIVHYGQTIDFSISQKNNSIVKGDIGIDKFLIHFQNNSPKALIYKDLMGKIIKKVEFKDSSWSRSDSLISLNAKKLAVKVNRNIAALEKNNKIIMSNKKNVYNAWSFQSYSCHSKDFSERECFQWSEKLLK